MYKAEKKKETRAFSKRRREILFVLVPAVIVAAVVLFILFFNDKASTVTLDGGYVQYYHSNSYEIKDGSELKVDSEGNRYLVVDNEKKETSNLILYSSEERKTILVEDMIYYSGKDIDYYRVDALTSVAGDGKTSTFSRDKNTQTVTGGFLFNGEDMYLLLEDTTVTYDEKSIELSAFSYVEVLSDGYVTFFDYDTKATTFVQIEGEAKCTGKMNGYELGLRGNSLTMHDGSKILLFSRPELLESIWDWGYEN